MTLWFADNNLQIPDTSYFYWVDRWGGSNMMMSRSLKRIQQDDVWCKQVSWAGNSTALIFIVTGQLFWLLLQICLQKSFVVCDTCKRNYALFDRLLLNCTTNSHRFNTDENTGTCPLAAVLITNKVDESPGSSRMGVIGALVIFFHLRPFRINFTLPDRPSSALRHWDIVEYSEVADSVHARTWSNEKTADMDGLRYSPDDSYYRLGPVHTCLYFGVLETGDLDLFLGPLEWARAETGRADQWVL